MILLTDLIDRPVLVRAHRAGVYLGRLIAVDGPVLRLRARRLWSWTGALDSTVLAATGPTGGRIGPETDVVLLPDAQVIEVLAASAEAVAALARVAPWQRS